MVRPNPYIESNVKIQWLKKNLKNYDFIIFPILILQYINIQLGQSIYYNYNFLESILFFLG